MLKIAEPTDDKAMAADWIAGFQWQWQWQWQWRNSGFQEYEAAEVIMLLLSGYPTLFAKNQYRPYPNEEVLFGKLATLLQKGALHEPNALSLALDRVWQT